MRAVQQGRLIPAEPAAPDALGGGKRLQSQTLPQRRSQSSRTGWAAQPRVCSGAGPESPATASPAPGTRWGDAVTPSATPAPPFGDRAPLALGTPRRVHGPAGCGKAGAGCRVTCVFVTPCHQPGSSLLPRGALGANPANSRRAESRRSAGGWETAPVPARVDLTPGTRFPKSLAAPGGAGLFVLRIWVRIVRCFAYVETGNCYFRRKGEAGPP